MMEPDDLVAEAAGAPGDAADDTGSWLASALQKPVEPPEPHSEPQRSYWESYVGAARRATRSTRGRPSPEPAASWLATYETSKEPPETVAADGVVAGVEARLRGGGLAAAGAGRPCRLRLKRRRGDGAACLVLVAPGAGGWARVPSTASSASAADDAGAGHALSLFDDRGDRREAHELAVGAAATRDALVLALEALAARERARHGVHRRRFRGPRLRQTVAAAREARRRPRTSPRAAAPVAVAEHFGRRVVERRRRRRRALTRAADGAPLPGPLTAGARSA
ncbi:hypothetical protein JL720_13043 [Aureococcus anophagefferens]|nr:hypothetical protein JL720_13043 [Aureococcus anophagefferens]